MSCTALTLGNSFDIQETSLKQVRSHNAELRRDVADMASTIERLTSLASHKGSASGPSKADEGSGSGGGGSGGSGSGAAAASPSSATGDHGGTHVAVESLQGVIRGLQREKQHMSEQLDRSVSESRLEAVQGELKSGMDALSCARGCYMKSETQPRLGRFVLPVNHELLEARVEIQRVRDELSNAKDAARAQERAAKAAQEQVASHAAALERAESELRDCVSRITEVLFQALVWPQLPSLTPTHARTIHRPRTRTMDCGKTWRLSARGMPMWSPSSAQTTPASRYTWQPTAAL